MSLKQRLLTFGVIFTALPLLVVGAGIWLIESRMASTAREGALQLADEDLHHIVGLVYSTCAVYERGRLRRLEESPAPAPGEPDRQAFEDLLNELKNVRIGQTGYIYILKGSGQARGHYVLSLGRKRDGENLWESHDADGRPFIQELVAKARALAPGQAAAHWYPWKNAGDREARRKVAVFTYFAPWDWVIAASVPEDEFLAAAQRIEQLGTRATLMLIAVALVAIALAVLAWSVVSGKIGREVGSLVGELTDGSSQVASAAGQVANSAQSLSQGATEQAASLEETSASMQEMASMTRQNAEHAERAAAMMGESHGLTGDATSALREMVSSMSAIRTSSGEVARIIKAIDEIAFQTNILALNAAVEAARAGSAGSGFAVVADEVRALARRSAQAAKDTALLIEDSMAKAAEGSQRVEQVAGIITAVAGSSSGVKTLVDDVHAASRQQAQGIDQVSQAVSRMEQVTQSTAAAAEESAAASEQLTAQAETTMQVVRRLWALIEGAAAARTDAVAAARRPAWNRASAKAA